MGPADRIKEIAIYGGAAAAGVVRAGDLAEFARFSEAAAQVPAGLAYLNREPLKRKNISNWYDGARSALVCVFRYWTPGQDYAAALGAAGAPAAFLERAGRKRLNAERLGKPGARIARYALCRDYHAVIKEKLSAALETIKLEFPDADGRVFCDTSPVLEKELARLAGLAFRGKNTLAVSRELGSYFFVGGLALNLELDPDAPCEDDCGSCSRCQRACPTGALKDGALDPALCISYWTTQAKEPMPEEIAGQDHGFAYGCDLCQEACPLNLAGGKLSPGFEPLTK
ncbi:MAG TPA: hypothetical protein DCZ92_05800 [Elusimicrobia bacterium]|nr:MAG: hypothetical protein A2016_07005 [Elusimicrobia bacterium GWF2_62_30]HBA60318.1 hypothetical protein [Elusimicrobiota bacterium]